MVTGPDRDPIEIQEPANLLGSAVPQNKRENAHFLSRGPDQTNAAVAPRRFPGRRR